MSEIFVTSRLTACHFLELLKSVLTEFTVSTSSGLMQIILQPDTPKEINKENTNNH